MIKSEVNIIHIHSNYQVLNRDEKKAFLTIDDHQVDVEWAKMTKHVSCWRIPKDQVISVLGIENLNPRLSSMIL